MSTPSPLGTDDSLLPPPVPWQGWRALGDTLIIFVLALFASQLLGGVALLAGLPQRLALPVLVVLSPMTIAIATVLWLRLRYSATVATMSGPRSPHASDLLIGLGLGVACFVGQAVIAGSVAAAIEAAGGELPAVQETFRAIAGDAQTAPLLVVAAVLLAPVAEELLFRGVLFRGLASRGFWLAAGVSALAFTLTHLEVAGSALGNLVVVVAIMPLGIAFAAIYAVRRSLLAVVVTHATYNALGVVQLVSLS